MKKFKLIISLLVIVILLPGCGIITIHKSYVDNGLKVLDTIEDFAKDYDEKRSRSVASKRDSSSNDSSNDSSKDEIEKLPEAERVYDIKLNETKLIDSAGSFTYGHMRIEIPMDFVGNVYVTGFEDGFSFYEAKSYDKLEGSGYMFGFFESDNNVMSYTGEQMIAYNPDYVYYLLEPTDVPYDVENPEAVKNYHNVLSFEVEVVKSLFINNPLTKYDAREYIYPMSEYKLLDEDSLAELTEESVAKAIGEIYARHGVKFDDYYMQNYFDKFSWYENKNLTPNEITLSEIEQENVDLINKALESLKEKCPYPEEVKMNDMTKARLNTNLDPVEIQVVLSGPMGSRDANIIIDGEVWTAKYLGVELENPCEDKYFITNFVSYDGSFELAIIDYGQNDNSFTYFFKLDDNKKPKFIGEVSGIPFKEYSRFGYGQSLYTGLWSYHRTDYLGGLEYSNYCYYDSEKMQIVESDSSGCYLALPQPLKELKTDIEFVYSYGDMDKHILKKGSKISIIYADESGIVRVHSKDLGEDLLIEVTRDMKEHPENYFSDIS